MDIFAFLQYLPANRVLPVQVQTVELELFNELDDVGDKLGPGVGIIHQPAVLVALRVIPASNGN